MLASSRAIAQAAVLGTAPVLAELELVREVAVLVLAAESLATDQAAAPALVIVRGAELVLAIVRRAELVLAIVRGAELVLAIVRGVVPELAIVRAEALVLIIAPAEALVLAIVRAEVQAPVIAPAVVREPETVKVEAVPVRSHLRARLAVPLRTKSATGPRRHDQVPLLTVEDLAAAVAETTLEPVAAEAVTAWEAAE
jgi:hypothetical protein